MPRTGLNFRTIAILGQRTLCGVGLSGHSKMTVGIPDFFPLVVNIQLCSHESQKSLPIASQGKAGV